MQGRRQEGTNDTTLEAATYASAVAALDAAASVFGGDAEASTSSSNSSVLAVTPKSKFSGPPPAANSSSEGNSTGYNSNSTDYMGWNAGNDTSTSIPQAENSTFLATPSSSSGQCKSYTERFDPSTTTIGQPGSSADWINIGPRVQYEQLDPSAGGGVRLSLDRPNGTVKSSGGENNVLGYGATLNSTFMML